MATTENYTTDTDWVVPDGVNEVKLECNGGPGGSGSGSGDGGSSGGGQGGQATGFLSVTPGETLRFRFISGPSGASVSGGNQTATGGGGGTGAEVRQGGDTQTDAVIEAGGGGGGGATGLSTASGNFDSDTSAGADGGGTANDGLDTSASFDCKSTSANGGVGGGDAATGTQGDTSSSKNSFDNYAVAAGGSGGAGQSGGTGGGANANASYDDCNNGRQIFIGAASGGGGGDGYVGGVHDSTTSVGVSSSAEISVTYPDVVDDLSTDNVWGTTEIDLSWTDIVDETGYNILRAPTSGSVAGDYSQIDTVPDGTTSYRDTGLDQGQTYYYRIEATFTNYENTLGNESNELTAEPTGLDFTDTTTEDELSISWDGVGDANEYRIYRNLQQSRTKSDYTQIDTVASGTTSYTDTGLDDGEEYHYVITAYDGSTESTGSLNEAAVTVLPAPTNLAVSNITDTTADLAWTNNHDNGSVTVQFRRSSNNAWQDFSTGLSLATESETLTGLLNGEEYDVRVLAVTEHTQTEDV